jgi:predicted transcriptional regulator
MPKAKEVIAVEAITPEEFDRRMTKAMDLVDRIRKDHQEHQANLKVQVDRLMDSIKQRTERDQRFFRTMSDLMRTWAGDEVLK